MERKSNEYISQHPKDFWKRRDGSYYPFTKDDIVREVNVFYPDTILPLMRDLDLPFIEEEWLMLLERNLKKDTRWRILGKYIARMNLTGWRGFTFQDSQYEKDVDCYIPTIVIEKNIKNN